MNILSDFGKDEQVKKVAQKTGISGLLFEKIFLEFKRKIISQLKHGNDEMLRVLSKTYCNSVSTDGPSKLYPLFFAFARKVHPMLNCIDEVKKDFRLAWSCRSVSGSQGSEKENHISCWPHKQW